MKIARREALKILGAGTAGFIAGGFVLPHGGKKHLITLSFDDGFEKSSIRTVEIYEKYHLKACINVIATAHLSDFKLPNAYHRWKTGNFSLWNDLKARGHEIMPHGYKHANLGEMPLTGAQDLVDRCIDVFNKELNDFDASESVFNMPFNSSTPVLENWLQTRFRAIRTHGGPVNALPAKGTFRLGCTSSGPENIDEHLTATIRDFLDGPPAWLIYNTHGLDDEGWGPLSSGVLDELLSELSGTAGVEILPVVPALNMTWSSGLIRDRPCHKVVSAGYPRAK